MATRVRVISAVLALTLAGPSFVALGDDPPMKNLKRPKEFHATDHLVGFWQFGTASGSYLALMERNKSETKSILSVWRNSGAEWKRIKKITTDSVEVDAFDGVVQGVDVFIGSQINYDKALQVTSCKLSELIDEKLMAVPFTLVTDLALGGEQLKKIKLSLGDLWSTVGISPIKYLFGPKFARGEIKTPLIIANTADGHAMFITETQRAPELASIAVANTAEPQAYFYDGQPLIAFKRYSAPKSPYWQRGAPDIGELTVTTRQGPEQNLSTLLGIGPVNRFDLAADARGNVFIFALREAPVGTDLLVITQADGGWRLKAQQPLEGELDEISARATNAGWQLVFAAQTKKGRSLQYLHWVDAR